MGRLPHTRGLLPCLLPAVTATCMTTAAVRRGHHLIHCPNHFRKGAVQRTLPHTLCAQARTPCRRRPQVGVGRCTELAGGSAEIGAHCGAAGTAVLPLFPSMLPYLLTGAWGLLPLTPELPAIRPDAKQETCLKAAATALAHLVYGAPEALQEGALAQPGRLGPHLDQNTGALRGTRTCEL